ncbi:MAG: RNA polymerase sigma factor [Gemmatimonadetes bacterium]|nr:RNA polymerase sigma factor [Gemmatimonadota bacterium]
MSESQTKATSPEVDRADARLAARGDRDAFERLYHRHAARIHTLARRMLGPDEADEATQDAFVRAWSKLASFRGDAAFGTWLHRLALNVILSRRAELARRRQRFASEDDVPEVARSRSTPPEARLDLETALARLPDGAREVFVLYDVEGYKHEEIAGLLGISVGTSKSQLHRARMLLRAHLA